MHNIDMKMHKYEGSHRQPMLGALPYRKSNRDQRNADLEKSTPIEIGMAEDLKQRNLQRKRENLRHCRYHRIEGACRTACILGNARSLSMSLKR